jgi:hypothetical protein
MSEALQALLSYQQADEDGVMVLTSRQAIHEVADHLERLRTALEEIRDHWANQYDHPRKQSEMYRGSYGIGVTDGHRACAIIATKALAQQEQQP